MVKNIVILSTSKALPIKVQEMVNYALSNKVEGKAVKEKPPLTEGVVIN